MGSNLSGIFDSTKRYSNLDFQKSQFVAPTDWDHMQDILDFDSEGKAVFNTGVGLKINAITNSPLLKIRANNDISDGCILTFEMTGINNVKWRKNGGVWSGAIVVVTDGVTWNESVGTSGLDIIFTDTAVALDSSEVWVGRGIRLLGGKLEHSAGVTYKLNEGKFLLEGKYVELADDTVAGCNNGDYVYLKVTETTVTHAVDTDIGHYTVDGQYADKSPIATKREYDLLASAVFPSPTVSPYARYVVVGKIINAAGGTFTSMWDNALDMQSLYRLYADTTPPVAPTGLTLSSVGEKRYVTMVSSLYATDLANFANLKMSCSYNPEFDIDYYEFKVVRLDAVPAPTTDSLTIHVKPNKDNGGAAIPIGADYTLRSLVIGITYRVWVRAVDMAGNVGTWSASVDQRIGGNCQIPVGDPAPVFTLTDTSGFVGFCVDITAVPANLDGITMWASESAYPVTANNEGFLGNYKGVIGKIQIPWKESGHPYVILQAYDENGLYHVDGVGAIVYSQDNIELAASAQLSTETHDSNISSHSGTISDCITCQQPHGSMYKWFNLLTHQAWTPENVYILAKSGSEYTTLDACLTAIGVDEVDTATIFVMPGDFTGATFSALPCDVTVMGLGRDVSKIGPCDVGSIAFGTTLTFQSVTIYGGVTGDNTGANVKYVNFYNCYLDNTVVTGNTNLDFDTTGAGSWFLRFINCLSWTNAANVGIYFKDDVDFIFDNCQIIDDGAVDIAVYLDVPTSTVRLFKNCAIQVTAVAGGGDTIDADLGGPYNVYCHGCSWNKLPNAHVTVQAGTVATNTVIALDYITG